MHEHIVAVRARLSAVHDQWILGHAACMHSVVALAVLAEAEDSQLPIRGSRWTPVTCIAWIWIRTRTSRLSRTCRCTASGPALIGGGGWCQTSFRRPSTRPWT
eukprot:14238547-Alexandrium_andersonii.AAC.1